MMFLQSLRFPRPGTMIREMFRRFPAFFAVLYDGGAGRGLFSGEDPGDTGMRLAGKQGRLPGEEPEGEPRGGLPGA